MRQEEAAQLPPLPHQHGQKGSRKGHSQGRPECREGVYTQREQRKAKRRWGQSSTLQNGARAVWQWGEGGQEWRDRSRTNFSFR